MSHETAGGTCSSSPHPPAPAVWKQTQTEVWSCLLLGKGGSRVWPEGNLSVAVGTGDHVDGRGAQPTAHVGFSLGHALCRSDHGLQIQVERPGLHGCEGRGCQGRGGAAAWCPRLTAPWSELLQGLRSHPAGSACSSVQGASTRLRDTMRVNRYKPPGVSPPSPSKRKWFI